MAKVVAASSDLRVVVKNTFVDSVGEAEEEEGCEILARTASAPPAAAVALWPFAPKQPQQQQQQQQPASPVCSSTATPDEDCDSISETAGSVANQPQVAAVGGDLRLVVKNTFVDTVDEAEEEAYGALARTTSAPPAAAVASWPLAPKQPQQPASSVCSSTTAPDKDSDTSSETAGSFARHPQAQAAAHWTAPLGAPVAPTEGEAVGPLAPTPAPVMGLPPQVLGNIAFAMPAPGGFVVAATVPAPQQSADTQELPMPMTMPWAVDSPVVPMPVAGVAMTVPGAGSVPQGATQVAVMPVAMGAHMTTPVAMGPSAASATMVPVAISAPGGNMMTSPAAGQIASASLVPVAFSSPKTMDMPVPVPWAPVAFTVPGPMSTPEAAAPQQSCALPISPQGPLVLTPGGIAASATMRPMLEPPFSTMSPVEAVAHGAGAPNSSHGGLARHAAPRREGHDAAALGRLPVGTLHRFHQEMAKTGVLSQDRRSFTKVNFCGRLSVLTEDMVRTKGVHSYALRFGGGELSNADGVGFILSNRLPCPKNIQRIVSIFANRTGRICVRANSEVVRCDVGVRCPQVGDWVTVMVDLEAQTAEFAVWSAGGGEPSRATLNYGQALDSLRLRIPSLHVVSSGYFACVIKNAGVSVQLGS